MDGNAGVSPKVASCSAVPKSTARVREGCLPEQATLGLGLSQYSKAWPVGAGSLAVNSSRAAPSCQEGDIR